MENLEAQRRAGAEVATVLANEEPTATALQGNDGQRCAMLLQDVAYLRQGLIKLKAGFDNDISYVSYN